MLIRQLMCKLYKWEHQMSASHQLVRYSSHGDKGVAGEHKKATRDRGVDAGARGVLKRRFLCPDIDQFSKLTGDTNPLHYDPTFAANNGFDKCIVHGALINGLVSAVMGTLVPGPGTILVNQSFRFPNPLYIGEEVTAEVVVNSFKMGLLNCSFRCEVIEKSKLVMEGKAIVMLRK